MQMNDAMLRLLVVFFLDISNINALSCFSGGKLCNNSGITSLQVLGNIVTGGGRFKSRK